MANDKVLYFETPLYCGISYQN